MVTRFESMKKIITLIVMLWVHTFIYANNPSYKGHLRVLSENYFKGAFVFGKFEVVGDTLFFSPKKGKKYIKKLVIPLSEVIQFEDINFRTCQITLKSSCRYTILLNKKKEFKKHFNIQHDSFSLPDCRKNDKFNDQVLFDGWGAFLYKRVKVLGKLCIEGDIYFYPNNKCEFKTINIKKERIIKQSRSKKGRIKIKLDNGDKYCFKDQLY